MALGWAAGASPTETGMVEKKVRTGSLIAHLV